MPMYSPSSSAAANQSLIGSRSWSGMVTRLLSLCASAVNCSSKPPAAMASKLVVEREVEGMVENFVFAIGAGEHAAVHLASGLIAEMVGRGPAPAFAVA